jgi:hypothetical protein
MTESGGSLDRLSSSSPRVEKECGGGVRKRHAVMGRDAKETAARTHHPADAPGLSIATLAQAARDFAPTRRTPARGVRRLHGESVEVVRANPSKPLGVQLWLGSLRGRHAS